MGSYTYTELLEIGNNFMQKTRIREFCSKLCRGKCCEGETKCRKHIRCDQKLPCVLYLCEKLRYFLRIKNHAHFVWKVEEVIEKAVGGNSYFTPYDLKSVAELQIGITLPAVFESKNIKNIRRVMSELIQKGKIELHNCGRCDTAETAWCRFEIRSHNKRLYRECPNCHTMFPKDNTPIYWVVKP